MFTPLEHMAEFEKAGDEMYRLIEELFPICRSITGNGVRQTLDMINSHIPLEIHEVPTGTEVFDWIVPKEWNIRDAFIKNSAGERVVDFGASNLHVVSYSVPVHTRMSLRELREHLFVHEENESWIPYRTTYYSESWGFCLSARDLNSLEEGEYEVKIDSTLEDGTLTYGEYYKKGRREDEVFLSCHVCHPSLCNDNLSGISLLTQLAKYLEEQAFEFSYRILFIPGTIGAITWLARNEQRCNRIRHGLVVTCVGDSGPFHYKKSRRGNAPIDSAAECVLAESGHEYEISNFSPYGYDERQFCSPGFNLPVGRLTRSSHGQFDEYHTSADNLDLVTPTALKESLQIYTSVIGLLENDRTYISLNPKCEPQLGKRGLYGTGGGNFDDSKMAMLWILNKSDGENSLLEIAHESGIPFDRILEAANTLGEHNLIVEKT